jgi:transcriptional regulator with GAF, ATPase, and Fis domain
VLQEREFQRLGGTHVLRTDAHRRGDQPGSAAVTAEHLTLTASPAIAAHSAPAAGPPASTLPPAAPGVSSPRLPTSVGDLSGMERAMIGHALQNARFNKSKAAAALGLTRAQLYVRMKRYVLE